MRFEWDETKRKINLKKHGFDFVDAHKIFDDFVTTLKDERFDYGEERFITLGLLYGRTVVLAHTEQEETLRLISLRKANKYEQKIYFNEVTNRLGKN